jgi:hypothetical protein
MYTVLLAGPGGNWMGLLIPLILFVLLVKGISVAYEKLSDWHAHRKHKNANIIQQDIE